jgi:glycerophosphoryl diester phosphodiesterase
MRSPDFLVRRPIAHRGYHDGNRTRYENAPAAFQAAIDRNFSIELDVQLSADGRAIVFHDTTLDRLTAQSGPVHDRTADELSAIAIGTSRDTIPTLEAMLSLIDGRVPVVIEMKDNGPRNPDLARAVAQDLRSYDGEAAVMSFWHDLLMVFGGTQPDVPFGLTAEGIGKPSLEWHEQAIPLGISFVSYQVKGLPNAFVEKVRRERAMPVITWTVKSPEDIAATRTYADQMTFEGFDPDE